MATKTKVYPNLKINVDMKSKSKQRKRKVYFEREDENRTIDKDMTLSVTVRVPPRKKRKYSEGSNNRKVDYYDEYDHVNEKSNHRSSKRKKENENSFRNEQKHSNQQPKQLRNGRKRSRRNDRNGYRHDDMDMRHRKHDDTLLTTIKLMQKQQEQSIGLVKKLIETKIDKKTPQKRSKDKHQRNSKINTKPKKSSTPPQKSTNGSNERKAYEYVKPTTETEGDDVTFKVTIT